MSSRPILLLVTLALAAAALPWPAGARPRARKPHGIEASLFLDGQQTRVRWIDGDTFKVESGPLAGFSTRLVGYNALETFGPVHRIGAASPEALWAIARGSAALAASQAWRCATRGARDGYGRALVSCPDAAAALVRAGHAMVFAVDEPPDPALLVAQREAQAARAGMWVGGVPALIPSSLHSTAEAGLGARGAYDRVVDTRTGQATARPHRRAYATCEEVCLGEGALHACLRYVPFERRYRDRPGCIGPKPEE